MSTTATAPRSTRPSSPAPLKSLSEVLTSKGSGLPNRYALHAVEGFGKTSFGAMTPKPVFLQSRGETGLETLIDTGLVPETPHFPECMSWPDLKTYIDQLTTGEHDRKTLVLDTINGAERLCHEDVCDREFGGDWGERGFASYGKGPEVAAAEWRLFLSKLDTLRVQRRMTIMLLCHTKVQSFKNPEGPDFDRYQPDMHKTTWGLTSKWADCILFGNFETVTETDKQTKRAKGKGGKIRLLYTERSAAYDAKNRLNLPEEIDMGSNAAEGWKNFLDAVKAGRTATATPVEVQ